MNKALFLPFDNVLINTKSGRKYPIHSKDWVLNIEVLDAIKYFYEQKYKILIIDNQIGVSDGYVHEDVFEGKVLSVIESAEYSMRISTNPICYSFWLGKREEYYKLPNPGIVYDMALEYELDLPNSAILGNSETHYNLFINSSIGSYIKVDDLINETYKDK